MEKKQKKNKIGITIPAEMKTSRNTGRNAPVLGWLELVADRCTLTHTKLKYVLSSSSSLKSSQQHKTTQKTIQETENAYSMARRAQSRRSDRRACILEQQEYGGIESNCGKRDKQSVISCCRQRETVQGLSQSDGYDTYRSLGRSDPVERGTRDDISQCSGNYFTG